MVATAAVHGSAVEEPHDRDERRVQDRDGEDEDRQHQGRDRRAGGLPARREAEGAKGEAKHLAARVAHECERASPRPQVEREETQAGDAEPERQREDDVVRMHGDGVDREEDRSDPGERRCEPVHVVQQVERIRHSDEPEDGDRIGERVVADELEREAAGDDAAGSEQLRRELRDRPERVHVVGETGEEEDRAADEDPEQLRRRRRGADGEARADAGQEPGEDPDAAEQRRGSLVPAVEARRGDDSPAERRANRRPDRECGHGKADRDRGETHQRLRKIVPSTELLRAHANRGLLSGCVEPHPTVQGRTDSRLSYAR